VTSKREKDIAEARYRAVVNTRKVKKMTIDTEIRHVTKVGSNLFQELGFSADSRGQLASTTPT
jgi:hypothetical protein